MNFIHTIRGEEVEVHAESWDGDESVGMAYVPEEVYANTLEGAPFELTDEEIEELTIKAVEIYYEGDRGLIDD